MLMGRVWLVTSALTMHAILIFFFNLCSMQNFTITALLKIIGNHLSPRMDRYGGTFIVVPLPGMENVL